MEEKIKCPDCGAEITPGMEKCPVCYKEIDIYKISDMGNPEGPTITEETLIIEQGGGHPQPSDGGQQPPVIPPQQPEGRKASKGPWIIVAILIAAIVGACIWFFVFYTDRARGGGGGGGGRGGDDDKTELTDSLDSNAVDSLGNTIAVSQTGQPAGNAGAVSPDLAFNQLIGPVKLVTQYTDYGYGLGNSDELFYSTTGEWLNTPTWNGIEKQMYPGKENKVERDGQGYISFIYEADSEGDSEESIPTVNRIIWENGKVVQRIEESNTSDGGDYYQVKTVKDYNYDDKGNLVKISAATQYDTSWGSSSSTEDTVYSYLKFDGNGNWTERSVNIRGSYDGSSPYTNSYRETRKILYY